MTNEKGPVILVAGASGYIGRALIPRLLEKFPQAQIVALSRSSQDSGDSRVQWRACDLFSLKSLEEALPQSVDLAFYLVHSMGPTASLDQGSFADYDLILADNFARALKRLNPQQVIYLGGLIPEEEGNLSLHLRSRQEVEETFADHQLPLTIFRAGLILGEAGSSFQILLKLVQRLPMMVCPQWTQTLTTPVDLPSVLEALTQSSLESQHIRQTYDLAGCRPLTYLQMMKETARQLGRKTLFITIPFFSPTLSRLWVSLVTNTPKALVYPLVESLEHSMVARQNYLFNPAWAHRSYGELLTKASLQTQPRKKIFRFRPRRRTVRSVQRLPLPQGRDGEWVKNRYLLWLPRYFAPLIKVKVDEELGHVVFAVGFGTWLWSLLELQLSPERSDPDRQLLYIKGGALVAAENKGRLEFRVVLRRQYVLAAIHDFTPALPWFIYKVTQAQLHALVMRAFAHHLRAQLKS